MSLTPAIVILSPPGADEESLFEAESQSAVIPSAREVRFGTPVESAGLSVPEDLLFPAFAGAPSFAPFAKGGSESSFSSLT